MTLLEFALVSENAIKNILPWGGDSSAPPLYMLGWGTSPLLYKLGGGGDFTSLLKVQSGVEVASLYYKIVFAIKMCLGVFDYADSESGVRMENERTVTEIPQPEILPLKFSRTRPMADLEVVLDADTESVVRVQISLTIPEILTFESYFQ